MVALARGMLDDPRWGWHAAQALGAEVPRTPAVSPCRAEALGAGRATARQRLIMPPRNLAIDAERLWGEIMETAAIGATREGRHLPADAHRSRPPGARLVQGPRRKARLHGHHRRHGRDVRAPRRDGGRAADRVRQPSRHPADRRQIRRRAGHARRAGGAAHAGRGRLRDLRAARGGELDQRGGLALCACHGVVGGVRRRHREGLGGVSAPTATA